MSTNKNIGSRERKEVKIATDTQNYAILILDTWLTIPKFIYSYFLATMALPFTADQHVRVMSLETGVNVSCDTII